MGRASVDDVRTTRQVVHSPHLDVREVECADHHAGWSPPETSSVAQVVLVQRGRFRVSCDGERSTVDPTTGYQHAPGRETRFAHPVGGDLCTSITLPDGRLGTGIESSRAVAVRVDARLELAHRVLLRQGADPDFAATEAVVHLLQLAVRRQPDESPAPGRRELADRAREAILADEPGSASLVALARLLRTSPAHLSRTFRHHAGVSLSRYRNRVRVSRAMHRLDEGETDLAGLAYSLGFSDQSHFTRVMRQHAGRSPGRVRTLLTHRPCDPTAR